MSKWKIIKNKYMYDGHLTEGDVVCYNSLLAWSTDDESEESNVIASVFLSKHGDIFTIYYDKAAKRDAYAQYKIEESKIRLKRFKKKIENDFGRYILLYANGYNTHIWKEYCKVLNVPVQSESIFVGTWQDRICFKKDIDDAWNNIEVKDNLWSK